MTTPSPFGNLRKMQVTLADPVQYTLPLMNGEQQNSINMNELLGQSIHLHHTGVINCIACGRKSNKSFRNQL